jgi:dehydrogenase/reductase SDR family protein 7
MPPQQIKSTAFSKRTLFSILLLLVTSIILFLDVDLYGKIISLLPYNEYDAFLGKKVWITGSSSGIGRSLALDLCKAGAHVALSARRHDELEKVAKLCREISNGRSSVLVIPLDVTDYNAQSNATDEIVKNWGEVIDILVLNAGRSQRKEAMNTSLVETRELFELNYFSYVNLANLVLPYMVAKNSGHLVILSSLSGIIATPIASTYSSTKFALHGYFDALRNEISKIHNIKIQIICPGPVESEISLHTLRDEKNPVSEEGKKMDTTRCTSLMVRAMFYKSYIQEIWISQQPFLFLSYLSKFAPFTSRAIFSEIVGPSRIRMLRNGENIYDVKALFKGK